MKSSLLLVRSCLQSRVRHIKQLYVLYESQVSLFLIILFMKRLSLEAFSLVDCVWDPCFKCWPDKCHCFATLQFDVICQNLWEDSAETSPQRAMENCAEYHRENNCSASAEWPECEFGQLSVSFPSLLLLSSLGLSSNLPPLVHLSHSPFLHLFSCLLFPHNTLATVQ